MKPTIKHRSSLLSIPLVKDLAIILVIKLVVILAIKWLFFSQPLNLKQSENTVERHLGVLDSSCVPQKSMCME